MKWINSLSLAFIFVVTIPLYSTGAEVSEDGGDSETVSVAVEADSTTPAQVEESSPTESINSEATSAAEKADSTTPVEGEEQSSTGQVLTAALVPPEKESDQNKAIYITGEVDGKEVLMFNRKFLEEQAAVLSGVGFGFEVGYWGTGTVVGLVNIVPLVKSGLAAMRFRIFMPFGPHIGHDFDPVINIEVGYVRRSPIFFGLLRLSAGGGLYAGFRPRRFPMPKGGIQAVSPGAHVDTKATCENTFVDPEGCRWGFSGGGFAGAEFILGKTHALFLHVGGQGYIHPHKFDSAFQITLGEIWYFGKKD